MKHDARSRKAVLVTALVIGVFLAIPVAAQAGTLDNLMAAYNGESNAHAKYLAYAEKADGEGYGKVASLFRAAAAAEAIHAKNHADVITKIGGTPTADVKLPEIKSTKENLADAIKGETYEHDTMYPGFLTTAKMEKNKDAVQTLNYAMMAEAEHAKMYQEALGNLDAWKTASTFYVCPVCGYTVPTLEGVAMCPVCATPTTDYKPVK